MAGGERKSEPQQDICPPPGGRQELSSRTSAVWRRREGRGLLRVTQQGGRSALVPMFLLTQGFRAITVLSPLCSELRVCQALSCPQNSQCSAEAPSCRCLPGFTQQGRACLGEREAWRSRWQGPGGRSFLATTGRETVPRKGRGLSSRRRHGSWVPDSRGLFLPWQLPTPASHHPVPRWPDAP